MALAATFDWRELANILQTFGVRLDPSQPENILEIQAHNGIHGRCHGDNAVSRKMEQLFNRLHARSIEVLETMPSKEILFFSLDKMEERGMTRGGFFWALAADSRPGIDCIRRHVMQRFMIRSVQLSTSVH